MHVEQQRGISRYSIELGKRARVESLPGVPEGASFLGTFDREEGVRRLLRPWRFERFQRRLNGLAT